jgi:hypothetical protein
MNDAFRGWAETHHEIVTIINYQINRDLDIFGDMPNLLDEILSTEGTSGIYDLCFELTNEFEKIHEGRLWDGDWLDAVIEFVQEKIS